MKGDGSHGQFPELNCSPRRPHEFPPSCVSRDAGYSCALRGEHTTQGEAVEQVKLNLILRWYNFTVNRTGFKNPHGNIIFGLSVSRKGLTGEGRPTLNVGMSVHELGSRVAHKGGCELSTSLHLSLLPDCGCSKVGCLMFLMSRLPL